MSDRGFRLLQLSPQRTCELLCKFSFHQILLGQLYENHSALKFRSAFPLLTHNHARQPPSPTLCIRRKNLQARWGMKLYFDRLLEIYQEH